MATYTDNYTMTKPTYAEQADISVINANMDIIDDVMHSSQISLAPAYDLNETYNTGDIVMHELLMYKCLEDNVTGAWDSTKWTRTTAGEESGGGADLDIYGEASGTAEASFSDGAEASLVKCIVEIEAAQSGSGTPSPSNIRPISGHSSITVTVASTSGGSGEDTTVNLGRTVYGGTLDVTTGELTVTKKYATFNDISTWTYDSTRTRFQTGHITDMKTVAGSVVNDIITSCAQMYSNNQAWDGHIDGASWTSDDYFYVSMHDYTSVTDLLNAIGDEQIVYTLATPQTFTLTKEQIQTLLGQNYVSHDGGGTISLVYVKGDAPIKPNPADAEIPLTGLEIDGEKFKIAGKEYSETSLYTYTGSTRQTTLELSDDFTEYDAIEFTFGWNLGGDDFETVNAVPSSKIVSGIFINVGGEGRYNYISKGTSNSEIILATATGSWDGSSIIREVRGIKY